MQYQRKTTQARITQAGHRNIINELPSLGPNQLETESKPKQFTKDVGIQFD